MQCSSSSSCEHFILGWIGVSAKCQWQPDQSSPQSPPQGDLQDEWGLSIPAIVLVQVHDCTHTAHGSSSPSFQACISLSRLGPHVGCSLSGLQGYFISTSGCGQCCSEKNYSQGHLSEAASPRKMGIKDLLFTMSCAVLTERCCAVLHFTRPT